LSHHIWRINYPIRDFGEWRELRFTWTILQNGTSVQTKCF
jgi:hypothetical protein